MFRNLDSEKIASWFAAKSAGQVLLFYNSVDIRDAGYKIAPVDTNIFPAGFNLLSETARKNAAKYIAKFFEEHYPKCKGVGLVAENFSRNQRYWENVQALKTIVENAGKKVLLGVTDADVAAELSLPLITQKDGLVVFGEARPCVVISNRDFTSGSPEVLQNVEQPIIPPVNMGWYRRKKSNHFDAYNQLAKEFANEFGLDPWKISAIHTNCGNINFAKREGLDCIATNVEKTLFKIRKKYDEYGVESDPYVYIKANSGTFGMGIMTVKSGEEVYEINKKTRNKMSSIKEGMDSTEVIIQEGVPTADEVDGKPAEPFVYMVGGRVVGALRRINQERDAFGNLNARGMEFEALSCSEFDVNCEKADIGVIGRLAALAVLHEFGIAKKAA